MNCSDCSNNKIYAKGLCNKCYQKERWWANREKKLEQSRKWKKEHREELRKKQLDYYYKNKDKINAAKRNNPEKIKKRRTWQRKNRVKLNLYRRLNYNGKKEYACFKKWVKNNPEKRKLQRKKEYLKVKDDPVYKLERIVRVYMHKALSKNKINKKGQHTFDLLGYSALDLKEHLESKFLEGMSWDNYGDWHIDHVVPICLAKNMEEVLFLNKLENLQPLWAEDNLQKGSRV